MRDVKTNSEKGEETRSRLMETGTRLFGIHGYHGVSVRMLAKEAGVNLAAVGYHFSGKQGLYEAIIQKIIHAVQTGPPAFDSRFFDTLKKIQSREELSVFIDRFIRDFMRLLIGKEDHLWAVFIMQNETNKPTDQFNTLYDNIVQPVVSCFEALVEAAKKHPIKSNENYVISFSLTGMCMHFVKGHLFFLQHTGWNQYDSEKTEIIGRIVSRQILLCLGLPLIQEEGGVL